jgi:putative hydrolase of the HAD superfamily
MLPRPEVVFLDLGDTLMRAHPSWSGVYRSVLVEHGIDIVDEDLAAALKKATVETNVFGEAEFEASPETSYERIKQFDIRVLAELGHRDLPDAFFRAIDAAFMDRSAWHVFPDVVPAVEALRGAGIRLGVISNWTWSAPELLHDFDLAHHFESLIISSRVGAQKPHPAIFRRALDELHVNPQRTVHVGDSYTADVVGARRVGIAPVLIDRRLSDAARTRDEHADPELPIIRDLYELLDLLGVTRPASPAAAG